MLRVLFLIGLLTILTAGAVFGVRFPNQYACLTLANYNTGKLTLYDPSHNFFAPETRYATFSNGWATPTEYYLLVTGYPNDRRRFDLVLQPINGTVDERIVIEAGAYQPSSSWRPDRVMWSGDARTLAYLWLDAAGQEQLTLYDLEDRSKRTRSVAQDYIPSLSLTSWSKDGMYLTLGEFGSLTGFRMLAILNVEQMTLEFTPDMPEVHRAAWSLDGHVLAAVVRTENRRPMLMMFNPDQAAEWTLIDINTTSSTQAISWSPDGSYIALARQGRTSGQQRSGVLQWYFDLYTSEGESVALDLPAKQLEPPVVSTSPVRPMNLTPNVVPGFWSQDGSTWIYLQERNHPRVSLVEFHPESGIIETLEANIVSDLYGRMFQTPIRYSFTPSDAVLPMNETLLMPRWQDGEIALEYVDYHENTRISLLTGADSVLTNAFNFLQSDQFLWGEDFLIPWIERVNGREEAHLTLISRADGSVRFDLAGMDSIRQITSVSTNWVGFIAARDGVEGIEIVELETGEHHRLPVELSPTDAFFVSVSPDRTQATVMVLLLSSSATARAFIRMYSLEDGTSRVVHESASPYGQWAPDGSAYVFFREGAGNGLQVVSAAGDILADVDFQGWMFGGTVASLSLSRWSQCQPNPQF